MSISQIKTPIKFIRLKALWPRNWDPGSQVPLDKFGATGATSMGTDILLCLKQFVRFRRKNRILEKLQ